MKFVCAKEGKEEFNKNTKLEILGQLRGWIFEFDGNPIELAIVIGDRDDLLDSERGYVREQELKQARKVLDEMMMIGSERKEDNSDKGESKNSKNNNNNNNKSKEKSEKKKKVLIKTNEEKQKREQKLLEHLRFI